MDMDNFTSYIHSKTTMKCHKGTQTTIVRMSSRGVQTLAKPNSTNRKRSRSRNNWTEREWWYRRNNTWNSPRKHSFTPSRDSELESDREKAKKQRWQGLKERSRLDKYSGGTSWNRNQFSEQRKNMLETANDELWDAKLPEKMKTRTQSAHFGTTLLVDYSQSSRIDISPIGLKLNDIYEVKFSDLNYGKSPKNLITNQQIAGKVVKLKEGEIPDYDGYSFDHGRLNNISNNPEDETKNKTGEKDPTTAQGSFRCGKMHHLKNAVQSKSNEKEESLCLNEVPTINIYSKSKMARLKELFGSYGDDDVQLVPLKSGNEKLSVDVRESNDTMKQNIHMEKISDAETVSVGIKYLKSNFQGDNPCHSTIASTDMSWKIDSLENALQKEITLKKGSSASFVGPLMQSGEQDQFFEKVSPSTIDDSIAKTDSFYQDQHSKSPEIVVFSNKYNEYIVEDINESETTIYITRKKKNKKRSNESQKSCVMNS